MSASNDSVPHTAQACAACHSRKVKCDAAHTDAGYQACTHCRKASVECRPHVRKRRRDAAPKNEHSQSSKRARQSSTAMEPPERGLSAQQQHMSPHVPTSSPQSSYLGRSEYVPAHVPIDEADASNYQNADHTLSAGLTGATSLPALAIQQSMRESLMRSFIQHCRPWMPLLTENEILRSDAERPDSLLTISILVAGSKVSTSPKAAEVGAQCYQRARELFFADQETDVIRTIIALIFLQWMNRSGPEHVSVHNSSFWLRIGVALAHQVGLHREPSTKSPDFHLRRVIWWTLVSRDCQIATSHGRPRAINLLDSDVRPLSTDDLRGSTTDAHLFLAFVDITKILGDITEHSLRGSLSTHARIEIEEALLRWIDALPADLHLHDRQTKRLNPYSFRSRHIHVPYLVALTILFHQRHSDQCPPMPSVVAASFISGIFEEYLDWGDITIVSPASIFYMFTAALAQISSHRFPALVPAEMGAAEDRIAELTLEQLKKRYATAYGAERVIKYTMRISRKAKAVAQSRPVDLSMSSRELRFFAHFGQELCRHWDVIEYNRGDASQAAGQGVGPRTIAGMDTNSMTHLDESTAVLGPSDDSVPYGDIDFGLGDLIADDAFGRLWWSDWMTQP